MVAEVILKPKGLNYDTKIREIRFTVTSIPNVLIGDTFTLSIFGEVGNYCPTTVVVRHWFGETLILQCDTEPNLLEMLVRSKKAIPREELPGLGYYQMPLQEWR